MPSIASELRPGLIETVVVTAGLVAMLWCGSRSACREIVVMRMPVASHHETAPPNGWDVWDGDPDMVLAPPAHPDARPWPHGMVIAPPPTPDPIARRPAALDRSAAPGLDSLLSGLLAPWRSTPS